VIKLFRNIRQKLLTEGKTSNYLKYAIGEIILVVIGILIALQINNWNENRKLKNVEFQTLLALQIDLNASLEDIDRDAKLNKQSLDAALKIKSYLDGKENLTDSIILAFEIATFDFKLDDIKAAYKSLQAKGLELITDNDLRSSIVYFYEVSVPFLQRNERTDRMFYELLAPYYQKHLMVNTKELIDYNFNDGLLNVKYSYNKPGFIPKDENQLKNDPEFRIILREAISRRLQVIDIYEEVLEEVKFLVAELNEKIEIN
jgi:hypothetical protein